MTGDRSAHSPGMGDEGVVDGVGQQDGVGPGVDGVRWPFEWTIERLDADQTLRGRGSDGDAQSATGPEDKKNELPEEDADGLTVFEVTIATWGYAPPFEDGWGIE